MLGATELSTMKEQEMSIGVSLFSIALGAILKYAVTAQVAGISFSTIGLILMIVGIIGLTFNDLRGTAVTRLALVGCTEAQIVSITGHALNDVRSILDAHYLHRDPELARAAIHKLELRYAKGRPAASCL